MHVKILPTLCTGHLQLCSAPGNSVKIIQMVYNISEHVYEQREILKGSTAA